MVLVKQGTQNEVGKEIDAFLSKHACTPSPRAKYGLDSSHGKKAMARTHLDFSTGLQLSWLLLL